MKKLILAFFILLLIFIAYLFNNAVNFKSAQLEVEPIAATPIPDGAVDRFVEAISIRTISFEDEVDFDSTQFIKFNEFQILGTSPVSLLMFTDLVLSKSALKT